MSDDFGTVNYKRGDRAREIERLRQHYLHHREALVGLAGDAPTELLAHSYQRLVHDIDLSLAKIADLEASGGAGDAPAPRTGSPIPPPPAVPPPPPPAGDSLRKTQPGTGASPQHDPDATLHDYVPPDAGAPQPRSRIAMMLVIGALVLAGIGWLIWRAGSDRRSPDRIVEAPVTETTTADTTADNAAAHGGTVPVATPAVETELAVKPAAIEYGTIRKGTRAVRQFSVTNNGDTPMSVTIARSQCRCLYYEYREQLAPKASETITVTIDGARAKTGELRESLKVSSKETPAVAATVELTATVQ